MTPSLDGCRAKIKRAGRHLKELDSEIQAWVETHPYRFALEEDRKTGEGIVRVRADKGDEPPPVEWGLIVGDITHNLRSALDHLTCQLATLNKASCDATQFPIANTTTAYAVEIRKRRVDGLTDRHKAMIKGVQPYHRRQPGLYLAVLRDLSNADKHRAAPFVPPRVEPPQDVLQLEIEYKPRVRMENGAEYARIKKFVVRTGSHVEVEFNPPYHILFGKWGEYEISPSALHALREHVRRIINRFSPDFR
jgi:hypothetical protein